MCRQRAQSQELKEEEIGSLSNSYRQNVSSCSGCSGITNVYKMARLTTSSK